VITRLRASWLARPWIAVALALVVGTILRLQGLTTTDLWFDDAWAALAQRYPLSTAIHMTQTTPGWSLAERQWNLLHPGVSWWAQLPQLVLGIAGIGVVAALLAWWRCPRWAVLLGTAVICVSPAAVTYSSRVKEYMADLVLSCLLLFLAEKWRRQGSQKRDLWLLVGALFLLPFISATLLSVTAGISASVLLAALFTASLRRQAAMICLSAVLGLLVLWELWLHNLTGSLKNELLCDGYLVNYASLHRFFHSAQVIGAGLSKNLLGLPYNVNRADQAIHPVLLLWSVVVEVLLVVMVVRPLRRTIATRTLDPFTIPAMVTVVAIAMAIVDVEPLGHGRTDIYLYPCLLLLMIDGCIALRPRVSSAVARAALAVSVVGLVCVACFQPLGYPARNLATPVHTLLAQPLHAQTAVVVSPWNVYTWALDELTPTTVTTKAPLFQWSAGFHVISLNDHIIISSNYFLPDWEFLFIHQHFDHLWYVASTQAANDPHVKNPNAPLVDRELRYLLQHGWTTTGRTIRATGVIIIELRTTTTP